MKSSTVSTSLMERAMRSPVRRWWKKAVRHPLQMAVHPNHQPVHDLIGSHVRVQAVAIAHQAPDQVGTQQQER